MANDKRVPLWQVQQQLTADAQSQSQSQKPSSDANTEEIMRLWESIEIGSPEAPLRITQITFCPGFNSIQLPGVYHKLKSGEDWREWERSIKSILVSKSLDKLIDINIARPDPLVESKETIVKWTQISKMVGDWLRQSATSTFLGMVDFGKRDKVHADEIWQMFADACKVNVFYAQVQIFEKYHHLVGSNGATGFDGVGKYSTEFAAAVAAVHENGGVIDPRMMILGYLGNLRKLKARAADDILRRLKDLRREEYTLEMCKDIMREVNMTVLFE